MGRDSGSSLTKHMLLAVVAICTFAGALPVYAADDVQTLPKVTVTASRNPGETPTEATYTDTVLKKLTKASRYPTSRQASQERPSGTTMVWFDLLRSGKVAGQGIEKSSGSTMLDQMALALVKREKYPALPADTWAADSGKHRFVVSYQFEGNAAGAPAKPRAPKP